jgi:GrpB-like predicted nucleotidyltransferase (UPF0157 family)
MDDKKREVILEAYQSDWQVQFSQAAAALYPVFWICWKLVYHIGSTAIPGLMAKPTLDLMLVVYDINKADTLQEALMDLGYFSKGENGIAGRRYYYQGEINHLTHLHVFEDGSAHVERHLLFRDYLRCHENEANAYSALKVQLAAQYRFEPEGYSEAKGEFIQHIDQLAQEWKQQTAWQIPAADWMPNNSF